MARKRIPEDRLIELQNKIHLFPAISAGKVRIIQDFANF